MILIVVDGNRSVSFKRSYFKKLAGNAWPCSGKICNCLLLSFSTGGLEEVFLRNPVIIFSAELFCYTEEQNTRGLVLWYCCVKSVEKTFHALLVLFEGSYKLSGTYRD